MADTDVAPNPDEQPDPMKVVEPEPAAEEAPKRWSPVAEIQKVLGEIDPEAMVSSFACVVEWIEPDGEQCLSVLHTPMPPWALHALMTFGRDYHVQAMGMATSYVGIAADEDEDDDD